MCRFPLPGPNVVRFLSADSGRFGCLPQANEADDCGVFVEVVFAAGDVPLGVAVDQVEEVHARVTDVVLVFPAVSEVTKPRNTLVQFGLEMEWDFEVDEDGAEVLGLAGCCCECSVVLRRRRTCVLQPLEIQVSILIAVFRTIIIRHLLARIPRFHMTQYRRHRKKRKAVTFYQKKKTER